MRGRARALRRPSHRRPPTAPYANDAARAATLRHRRPDRRLPDCRRDHRPESRRVRQGGRAAHRHAGLPGRLPGDAAGQPAAAPGRQGQPILRRARPDVAAARDPVGGWLHRRGRDPAQGRPGHRPDHGRHAVVRDRDRPVRGRGPIGPGRARHRARFRHPDRHEGARAAPAAQAARLAVDRRNGARRPSRSQRAHRRHARTTRRPGLPDPARRHPGPGRIRRAAPPLRPELDRARPRRSGRAGDRRVRARQRRRASWSIRE